MCSLYETLFSLCKEKNITGYRMCKDVGIQPSIMTDLKNGRRSGVGTDTAIKLANYFNVSVEYLLGKSDEKKSVVNGDEELNECLEELKNRSELRMLFKLASKATKEDVEQAAKIIAGSARSIGISIVD